MEKLYKSLKFDKIGIGIGICFLWLGIVLASDFGGDIDWYGMAIWARVIGGTIIGGFTIRSINLLISITKINKEAKDSSETSVTPTPSQQSNKKS